MPSTNSNNPPTNKPAAAAPAPAAAAAAAPAAASSATAAAGTTTSAPKKKKATAKKAGATKAKVKKKTATGGTTKRKKASGSSSRKSDPSVTAESVYETAKLAQLDLARQRAQAAACRSDPLWYRMEDVLLPMSQSDVKSNSILPDQIQIVDHALALGGLTRADVTPQAMACLLEQARKYAHHLFEQSQDYAYMAGRVQIERDDVFLAKEMSNRNNSTMSITSQLPKLQMVVNSVNRAPLPPIPSQCYSGVLLPPKPHQLTARTFDIVVAERTQSKRTLAVPESPLQRANASTKNNNKAIGYGASRGRTQIPIHLDKNKTTTDDKSGDAMDTT